MALSDRFAPKKTPVAADPVNGDGKTNGVRPPVRGGASAGPASDAAPSMYSVKRDDEGSLSPLDQLKVDLHRRLISRLDLDALERIKSEAELTSQIRQAVLEFIREEATPLSQRERDEIVEQVIYEVTGLGPIEPL
jgi:pilus assembly protein CpaF